MGGNAACFLITFANHVLLLQHNGRLTGHEAFISDAILSSGTKLTSVNTV